jgi:hypothetical protein
MAVAPLGRSELAIDRTMQAWVVVVPRRAIGGSGDPALGQFWDSAVVTLRDIK